MDRETIQPLIDQYISGGMRRIREWKLSSPQLTPCQFDDQLTGFESQLDDLQAYGHNDIRPVEAEVDRMLQEQGLELEPPERRALCMQDLLKEYDKVFPGLSLFVQYFKGKPAFQKFSDIVSFLDDRINDESFEQEEASDFAISGTG